MTVSRCIIRTAWVSAFWRFKDVNAILRIVPHCFHINMITLGLERRRGMTVSHSDREIECKTCAIESSYTISSYSNISLTSEGVRQLTFSIVWILENIGVSSAVYYGRLVLCRETGPKSSLWKRSSQTFAVYRVSYGEDGVLGRNCCAVCHHGEKTEGQKRFEDSHAVMRKGQAMLVKTCQKRGERQVEYGAIYPYLARAMVERRDSAVQTYLRKQS